jgi:DNA polymerase-3 subunit epsilon
MTGDESLTHIARQHSISWAPDVTVMAGSASVRRDMENLQFEKPLVFFDLETTGISAPHDRIVELTAIRLFPDGRRSVWSKRMNPGMPIPKSATDVHGITNEDVAGEPGFSFYAAELQQFIGESDLGGFGVSRLDIPLLEAEFRRAGVEFSRRGRRIVDAQILFHMLEPRDLAAAYKKYCGADLTNAHTSEGDVEASMAVVEGMLNMHADLPRNVEGLNALCNREQESWIDSQGKFTWSSGVAVVGFGKYKGVPIRAIVQTDPGYFDWMLKSDFAEDTKAVAARALRGDYPDAPDE